MTITGTDRELEWDNGWGYWQLPWEEWVKGSALHAPDAAQRPAPATPAQPLPQR